MVPVAILQRTRTRYTTPSRQHSLPPNRPHLSDDGAGGGALVLPGGGEDTVGLVVASETVDTRLDQNHAELGVAVLAVALKVLADGDGLGGRVSTFRDTEAGTQGCSPS